MIETINNWLISAFKIKPFDMYTLLRGEEKIAFDRMLATLKTQLFEAQFDLECVTGSYFLLGYLQAHGRECFPDIYAEYESGVLDYELNFIPIICSMIGLLGAVDSIKSISNLVKSNQECFEHKGSALTISPKDSFDYSHGFECGFSDYIHYQIQQYGGDKIVECNNLLRWLRNESLDYEELTGHPGCFEVWQLREKQIVELKKSFKQSLG
jgi:hypothetical protein